MTIEANPPAAGPQPHRKRVLLVDDSSGFRGLLQLFLSTVPGVEIVAEAADGLEAIAEVQRTNPDLVLMDVRMPNLNGLQATKQLRAGGASVQILLLSAYGESIPRWLATEVGADGVLDKSSLGERLREAISTPTTPHVAAPQGGEG